MKLYFSPGACSLSPHIVLREIGMKFDLEQVNNQEKKTKSGMDYWGINAKGQVPAGRLGHPDEFGDLVAFLCSERAAYVTGTVIPIDGGFLRSAF